MLFVLHVYCFLVCALSFIVVSGSVGWQLCRSRVRNVIIVNYQCVRVTSVGVKPAQYQEWAAWRGRCEKYCKVVFNASPWPLSLVWYVTDFKLFYATISNTIFIRLWQASPIFPFAKQMAKERKFESLKLSGSSSPPWGTFTPLGYHTGKIMFHQVNIFKKCKHAQWGLIGK